MHRSCPRGAQSSPRDALCTYQRPISSPVFTVFFFFYPAAGMYPRQGQFFSQQSGCQRALLQIILMNIISSWCILGEEIFTHTFRETCHVSVVSVLCVFIYFKVSSCGDHSGTIKLCTRTQYVFKTELMLKNCVLVFNVSWYFIHPPPHGCC